MKKAWGAKWCTHLNEADLESTMSLWKRETNVLTDEQFTRGFDRCVNTLEFPPSIAQFKRAAYDILPVNQAYDLKETNRIAQEAWYDVDSWLKKTAPEKEVKAQFVAKYENLCEKILTGVLKR
jgi:hypothetical protein